MFDSITKIVNLYVGMLAILVILATINIFPLQTSPEIRILKPVYIFNMSRIIDATKQLNQPNVITIPASLYGTMTVYGLPEGYDRKYSLPFGLPYEKPGDERFSGWFSQEYGNPWYNLGLSDSTDIPQMKGNTLATRRDEEKMYALSLLFTSDFLQQAKTESLKAGPDLRVNPLAEISKYADLIEKKTYKRTVQEYDWATKVYSFISIANPSSVSITEIDVFINDVVNYGMLEVVGWTGFFIVEKSTSNSPNIKLHHCCPVN